MKEFFATTKNGIGVYVDMEHSHASTHFEDTPQLIELCKQAIENHDAKGELDQFEEDLGRVIGKSDLVETSTHDDIVYAKRKNREKYSRFAKNKSPQPTSSIVVRLIQNADQKTYDLYTCFLGKIVPSFPEDENSPQEQKDFWNAHALAWGTQEITPGTETKKCPW